MYPVQRQYESMERYVQYGNRKIYCKGDHTLLDRQSIAVIGTRNPSEKSRIAGYRMAKRMCEFADFPIVTGLAIGCDTIASRAALDSGRPVIAVLPSGTGNIYPRSNTALAAEIVEKGGCLVSEYSPESYVEKWKFIARDRLTAEIASAVVVIQCGEASGTMHTVRAAHSLSRKLGCWIPSGTITGDFSGNHLMTAEFGASGIRSIDELKEFLKNI